MDRQGTRLRLITIEGKYTLERSCNKSEVENILEEVINVASEYTNAIKGMGMYVNEDKTKYTIVSRRPPNMDSKRSE